MFSEQLLYLNIFLLFLQRFLDILLFPFFLFFLLLIMVEILCNLLYRVLIDNRCESFIGSHLYNGFAMWITWEENTETAAFNIEEGHVNTMRQETAFRVWLRMQELLIHIFKRLEPLKAAGCLQDFFISIHCLIKAVSPLIWWIYEILQAIMKFFSVESELFFSIFECYTDIQPTFKGPIKRQLSKLQILF